MSINVKIQSNHTPSGTTHDVRLTRGDKNFQVTLADVCAVQGVDDARPNAASLATRLVLELERELAELRARMIVANLWDPEVRL